MISIHCAFGQPRPAFEFGLVAWDRTLKKVVRRVKMMGDMINIIVNEEVEVEVVCS